MGSVNNGQLGWLVALCAKAAVSCMIACTNVLLSEGKDRRSMESACDYLRMVSELEDKCKEARRAEREFREHTGV